MRNRILANKSDDHAATSHSIKTPLGSVCPGRRVRSGKLKPAHLSSGCSSPCSHSLWRIDGTLSSAEHAAGVTMLSSPSPISALCFIIARMTRLLKRAAHSMSASVTGFILSPP